MDYKRYKDIYQKYKAKIDFIYYICLIIALADAFFHDAEESVKFAVVLNPAYAALYLLFDYLTLPLLAVLSLIFDHKGKASRIICSITMILTLVFQIIGGEALAFVNLSLFVMTCLVVAAKNRSFTKIAWIFVIVSASLLVLVTVLSILGLIPDLIFEEVGRPNRHSLGMQYPLNYIAHWFSISLVYCYLKRGYLKVWDYAGLLVVLIISMFVCKAQTSSVLFTVLIAGTMLRQLYLIYNKRHSLSLPSGMVKARKRIMWCLQYSFIFFAAFMIIGSILYIPPLSTYLDKISRLGTFFSRFSFGRIGLQNYFPSVLGVNYPINTWDGTNSVENYFFVDCSYIFTLLHCGVILFVIFMSSLVHFPRRLYKLGEGYALCILALFACICAMEHHLTDLGFNIFWLMTFADLGEDNLISKSDIV